MDRRRLLQAAPPLLSSVLMASALPLLSTPAFAASTPRVRLGVALLVPQSGQYAALGRSMERAAALAQVGTDAADHHDDAIKVYDTAGTPAGAAAAARAARKGGATLILGPLFAREVPAVLAVAGRDVPVITFSNDAALIEGGAFLLGLTARQSAAAILGYAAQRGVRRIVITGTDEGWGAQARVAATALAPAMGIALIPTLPAPGGDAPDAVLALDAASLAASAAQWTAQGIQPLGAFQSLDLSADMVARIEGSWLTGPDPERFAGFSRAYEQRNGSPPGMIAALAYDAAGIAGQLRRSGGTDRSAILSNAGFKAICGNVRFHEDGTAARSLAILEAKQGLLRTVATWSS